MARRGTAGEGDLAAQAGRVSSIPPIEADASNVVWAMDLQFDSTVHGKAIKTASMIYEHTRVSLLNIVERSITADRLVEELKSVFAAAGGSPKVLRTHNGPERIFERCKGSAITEWACPTFRQGAVEQRLHLILQQPPT